MMQTASQESNIKFCNYVDNSTDPSPHLVNKI